MNAVDPNRDDPRPLHGLLPPAYFLIALLGMAALHFLLPLATVLRPPVSYAGVLLVGVGLRTVLAAANLFTRRRTAIKPFEYSTALVTEGVYRMTRNPMYLGLIVLLLGVATLFGTLTPLFVVPVFAGIMRNRFIRPEEAMLAKRFGTEYAAYSRKVRRWL